MPDTNALGDVAPHHRADGPKDLKQLLESYERALIETALAASGGNQRQAAQLLGLLPTTLNEKMKRLGLRRHYEAPPSSRVHPSGSPSAEAS